jgi:hypothetical protein
LIPRDEKTHDELMDAFRQYYKANQKWMDKGTRRAAMDTRLWLLRIYNIARNRRHAIMDWRREINQEKAEKQLQKAQEQAEKDAI